MNSPYSAAFFSPHIGSAFVHSLSDGREFALTLDSVETKPSLNAGEFHTFTLFFSGDREAFFSQGSYLLRHPVLGEHDIFITAISETETHFRYQAPFSVRKAQ